MSSQNGASPQPATLHTFAAIVEDKPGVLNRVASLFRRRGFNIHSLSVGPTDQPGVSRMTLVVRTDKNSARHVEANLYKLVNVLKVEDLTYRPSVSREMALIKVGASGEQRAEIMQICEVFRARVVDVAKEALIVEITGDESKIKGLLEVLEPFGVIEMARTGSVALTRGVEPPTHMPDFLTRDRTAAA
ncbi:MAG: acetolactate synthase small subunit [Anaerolineales bacterium]|nr:acetolactate synthase small subunit [Anaerolineales bacterium]